MRAFKKKNYILRQYLFKLLLIINTNNTNIRLYMCIKTNFHRQPFTFTQRKTSSMLYFKRGKCGASVL